MTICGPPLKHTTKFMQLSIETWINMNENQFRNTNFKSESIRFRNKYRNENYIFLLFKKKKKIRKSH